MVKVNVPERITEPSILSLLNSKVPTLGIKKIRRFDFAGRDSLNEGYYEVALYKKIIAAKLYEQKIIAAKLYEPRLKHSRDIFDAAMCYDRASRAAHLIGFSTVDFRCAIRSALLHKKNLASFEHEKSIDGLDFARENIWNHFEYRLVTSVYTDNHIWFP